MEEGKKGVERVLFSSEGGKELEDCRIGNQSTKDQQSASTAPEADPQPEPEVNIDHEGPSHSSPRELKTSDVYLLKGNVPKRFDHPGQLYFYRD